MGFDAILRDFMPHFEIWRNTKSLCVQVIDPFYLRSPGISLWISLWERLGGAAATIVTTK